MLAMKVRIARHTDRLEEVVAFYRDLIGLRQTGRFLDHEGYDGAFLEIPGTHSELEFTAGGEHSAPVPHPESVLVLYFDTRAEVEAIVKRIGHPEVIPANPFWQKNATAFSDPDGYQILLVPRN
jgi:catechol 2,3-dioxygenase-like lactoylglutathione lyase family enzyme